VITPNGLTLPWKVVNGVKVYHLIAEPVSHEFIPAMEDHPNLVAECWGYNGRVHGPTIEAVEGDHVRIYVHESAVRADERSLARNSVAERHGRRGRVEPARHSAGRNLQIRVHAQATRHVHVPTRITTR